MTNTNLLQKSVIYGQKSFKILGPGPNVIKTFYVRNLRMYVISQRVCPRQAFPVQSNKHSSLVALTPGRQFTASLPGSCPQVKYILHEPQSGFNVIKLFSPSLKTRRNKLERLSISSFFPQTSLIFVSTGGTAPVTWDLYYKTFYACNLQIFVMSQSVCPLHAFPAQSNVYG